MTDHQLVTRLVRCQKSLSALSVWLETGVPNHLMKTPISDAQFQAAEYCYRAENACSRLKGSVQKLDSASELQLLIDSVCIVRLASMIDRFVEEMILQFVGTTAIAVRLRTEFLGDDPSR